MTNRRYRAIFAAILTACALFIVGYGVIRNEARIDQNSAILEGQIDLLDAIKAQATANDASRKTADAALIKKMEDLLKVTTRVQEEVRTEQGREVVVRTVTRTRIVCVRPNGRPC